MGKEEQKKRREENSKHQKATYKLNKKNKPGPAFARVAKQNASKS